MGTVHNGQSPTEETVRAGSTRRKFTGEYNAEALQHVGLTTMPEMGLSFFTEPVKHGATRNRWNPERGVGGSSGGAAALVAAGAVPVAHGNDGAGSIRIPAVDFDLLAKFDAQNRVSHSVGAFFTTHDLLITPTLGQLPAPHDALRYDNPDHTVTSWVRDGYPSSSSGTADATGRWPLRIVHDRQPG
jgi:Asp-tRNA(Asn)/Glu-tRNA(Gln) amidotransferase A subunit family amidase